MVTMTRLISLIFDYAFYVLIISIVLQSTATGLVVTNPCCHVFPHRGAMFGPQLPLPTANTNSDSDNSNGNSKGKNNIFTYLPDLDRPVVSHVSGPLKLTQSSNPALCHPERVAHQNYTFENAIALIPRGGCSFAEKVYFAQLLGAKAAVVFQAHGSSDNHGNGGFSDAELTGNDDVIVMAEDSRYGNLVEIPSAFISYNSWRHIYALFQHDDPENVAQNANGEDNDVDVFVKPGPHLQKASREGLLQGEQAPKSSSKKQDLDTQSSGAESYYDVEVQVEHAEVPGTSANTEPGSKRLLDDIIYATSNILSSTKSSDESRDRRELRLKDYETSYAEKLRTKREMPMSQQLYDDLIMKDFRSAERFLSAQEVFIVLNETGSLAITSQDALPMMWDSMIFLIKVFVIIWSVMGCAYVSNWAKLQYRRLKRKHVIKSLPCKQYKKLQVHSNTVSVKAEEKEKTKKKSGALYNKLFASDEEVDLEKNANAKTPVNIRAEDPTSISKTHSESEGTEDSPDQEVVTLEEYTPPSIQTLRQGSDLKLRSSPRKSKEKQGGSFSDENSNHSNSQLQSGSSHSESTGNPEIIACDNCVVCLCEFDLDDFVTVLPCKHIYHKDCIEPWLVNKSSLCPICKQSIFKNGESRSINELNESEMENNSDFGGTGWNDQDEQRRGSVALSVGMFLVIVLSFTFIMSDDNN